MNGTIERDRILARLRQHYAERTPVFAQLARIAVDEGIARCIPPPTPDCRMPMDLMQRLMRGAVAEFEEAP